MGLALFIAMHLKIDEPDLEPERAFDVDETGRTSIRRKVDLLRRVPEVNACFSNAHHILMDGRPHPRQCASAAEAAPSTRGPVSAPRPACAGRRAS